MKNVIDLTGRLKKADDNKDAEKMAKAKNSTPAGDAPVIDMTEKRNEITAQERRNVKRTILTEFVGAMVLIPSKGLLKVALYDISIEGLAFDIQDAAGHFSLGEGVAMRVYLNQQTYFPFVVKIQNIRAVDDENMYRHGANFVKDTINTDALHHFVRFIETVASSLQTDPGDMRASSVVR